MAEKKLEKALMKLATRNLADLEAQASKDSVEQKLFFAAIQAGNLRAVHGFFLKDIDINAADEHGRSGLHIAALSGQQDIFNTLLNKGADQDQSDKQDITPLMCASQKGSEIIVDALLQRNADVKKRTSDGLNAVFYALYNNHVNIAVKLETKESCIHDMREESVVSIYMKAVRKNWIDVVKYMHDNRCEISYKHKLKIASQAALCGHTEMLQYFKVKYEERLKDGRSPLRCAVQNGFIDAVRYMLDNGCDVNGNEECVKTAIVGNHLEILKLLLEKGAPMFTPDEDGVTPVQLAIVQGSFEMFKYLVESGCSIEPHKELGSLTLIAASRRNTDVLKYLAENKLSINEADPESGETPLLAASQRGPFEVVELLLDHECDMNARNRRGVTPALRAAHNKQEEILMLLGERGANLDIPNRIGETAILCAARNKSLPMVQYLAEQGCKLDTKDDNGRTLTYYAVETNNVALLRFLQRRNVFLDEPDVNGVTPLMTAVKKGAMDAIKQLVSSPNLCNLNHRDWRGKTAMHLAAARKLDTVKLLHENGADLNTTDHEGNTPLIECVKSKKVSEVLQYLIEKNCDLQGTNNLLRSAVHYACMQQENDALMLLLDAKCAFDLQDRFGMTPFLISAFKGNESLATILKAVAADVNTRNFKGENAVHLAAKSGSLKVIQILSLFGCSLDQEDNQGLTPLIIACAKNKANIVEFLCRKGADVSTITHSGETPAHFACRSGSLEVIKILQRYNAQLDQTDLNGVTPILVACSKQNEEFLKFLCNNKCDIKRTDKAKKTALHYAVMGKYEPVIRFLIDKGLDPNAIDDSGTSPVLLSIKLNAKIVLNLLKIKGGIVADIFDNNSWSAAHFACQEGNLQLLQELRGQVSFASRTADGENCLTVACQKGHEEIVSLLLEEKLNVNFKNLNGDNALHIAARNSYLHLIPILLKKGIRVKDKNAEGNTALHILCLMTCSSKLDKVKVLKGETDEQLDQLTEALNERPEMKKSGIMKLLKKTKELPDKLLKLKLPGCVSKKELVKQLTSLLDAGVDVNEANNTGKRALHFACKDGSKCVIELLLSRGAEVNSTDADEEIPIFTAVRQGKEKAVSLLIKNGADLTKSNKDSLSPLAVAYTMNNNRIVSILQENGGPYDGTATVRHIDIETVFKRHNLDHLNWLTGNGFDGKKHVNGKTLLHYAILSGDLRLVQSLMESSNYPFIREIIDKQDNNGDTALHLAVSKGRLDVAELLIRAKCLVDIPNQRGHMVLQVAASQNKLSLVKKLVEICPQSLEAAKKKQENHETPIHIAAIKGNLMVFNFFVENGFSIEAKSHEGMNCAHYAAIHGNLEVIEHVAKKKNNGKNLLHERNSAGLNPIQCAILNGHEEIAKFIYKTIESEIEFDQALQSGNQLMVEWVKIQCQGVGQGTDKKRTSYYAASSGSFHLARQYLEKGDLEVTTANNAVLTHAAAARNHRHLLKFMSEENVHMDLSDDEGNTGVSYCAVNGHLEAMKLLQQYKCNLQHKNGKSRDIVHLACIGSPIQSEIKGHLNIVKFACDQKLSLDDSDNQGNSPLMYACRQGFKDIVEFLLSGKHSDPNRANAKGTSAAHLAVMADRSDILEVLSQHGARLDAEDSEGTTPLMIAIHKNSFECVDFLIDKMEIGVENRINKNGWSVLRLAAFANADVRQVMERRGVQFVADDAERPAKLGIDIDMDHCIHKETQPRSRIEARQGLITQNKGNQVSLHLTINSYFGDKPRFQGEVTDDFPLKRAESVAKSSEYGEWSEAAEEAR